MKKIVLSLALLFIEHEIDSNIEKAKTKGYWCS